MLGCQFRPCVRERVLEELSEECTVLLSVIIKLLSLIGRENKWFWSSFSLPYLSWLMENLSQCGKVLLKIKIRLGYSRYKFFFGLLMFHQERETLHLKRCSAPFLGAWLLHMKTVYTGSVFFTSKTHPSVQSLIFCSFYAEVRTCCFDNKKLCMLRKQDCSSNFYSPAS